MNCSPGCSTASAFLNEATEGGLELGPREKPRVERRGRRRGQERRSCGSFSWERRWVHGPSADKQARQGERVQVRARDWRGAGIKLEEGEDSRAVTRSLSRRLVEAFSSIAQKPILSPTHPPGRRSTAEHLCFFPCTYTACKMQCTTQSSLSLGHTQPRPPPPPFDLILARGKPCPTTTAKPSFASVPQSLPYIKKSIIFLEILFVGH